MTSGTVVDIEFFTPLPYQYVTTTQVLNPSATRYTRTLTGLSIITYLVGSPAPYVTTSSTTTISPGQLAYTQTITGDTAFTIIYATPAPSTVSSTTYLKPYSGESAYTTTTSGNGATPATIIYGIPESVLTTTVYGTATGTQYIPPNGPTPGTKIDTSLYSYITTSSYLDPLTGGTAYVSTMPGPGPTETVVVGIPESYTTTFVYGPAAGSSTQPPYENVPGTVIITLQQSTTTTTTYVNPSAGGTAFSSTIPAYGPIPGTVIIGDVETYTTTTNFNAKQTDTFTIPPHGSTPGTIVVDLPMSTTTITSYLDPSNGGPSYTSTVPAMGTTQGTVIYGIPERVLTSTVYGSVSGTSYNPPFGPVPGIEIITAIESTTTTTTFFSTTEGYTSTLIPPASSQTVTVVVGYSQTYTTTTIFGGAGTATYTIPAKGTNPGTIEVLTPYATVSTSSLYPYTGSTYTVTIPASPANPTGTIITEIPESYATSTLWGAFTASTFIETSAAPGVEGFEVVWIPYTTLTTTEFIGPGGTPTTITIPASSAHPTGTVVDILTQGYTSVTTYGNFAPGTTTFPPTGTTLGTIEYSMPYVTTTIFTYEDPLSHGASYFTSTFSANQEHPTATMLIGSLESYTSSTVYNAASPGASTIAPVNGVPGTIIYSQPFYTISSTTYEDPLT